MCHNSQVLPWKSHSLKRKQLHLLSESCWVPLLQLWVNEHDLIVDNGPQNLQALDVQLILPLTLHLVHVLQVVKRNPANCQKLLKLIGRQNW